MSGGEECFIRRLGARRRHWGLLRSSATKGVGMSFTPIMVTKVELKLGRRVPDGWENLGSERPQRQRQRKMRPFLLADPGTRACPLSQASRCLSSVIHPGGRHRTSIQQKSVFVGTMNKGRATPLQKRRSLTPSCGCFRGCTTQE